MPLVKNSLTAIILFVFLASCEEVIRVDLNSHDQEFVVEAMMYKDSIARVYLTRTTSYFSLEKPDFIEDAIVKISDGTSLEELKHIGNGYYIGSAIFGTEERTYKIEILYNGIVYKAISYLPAKSDIVSVHYNKSEEQSPLNPYGKTVFTINCQFKDDPAIDNYYMIRFMTAEGKLLERYYLLTEDNANSGNINNSENGIISFSESIFYEGGDIEVQLFSIDEPVYNYFLQLTDMLYWKRRVMPPTPYNPASNINNGALGYFAAWAYDSEKVRLE